MNFAVVKLLFQKLLVQSPKMWCEYNFINTWAYQCDVYSGCKVAVPPGGKTGETGETGETGNSEEGEDLGDNKKGVETAQPTKTPETK